jgi:hypothetical protein
VSAAGQWGPITLSPPVSASDIRKWAIATHWPATPPPIHWDEKYGSSSRWGGIVAPPDFNPFAWPVHRPVVEALPGCAGMTALNGGQVERYGVPQRPGDVIAERSRIQSYKERQGRFGLMLYVLVENEWTNQNAELVRCRVSTFVCYGG